MLKLKLQYFGHLMRRVDSLEKTLMLGGIGGRRRRGRQRMRCLAPPTRWTWVWVNSGSWWWTGRPGMLQFMGSQRVGHDWVTELNWTELNWDFLWWSHLVILAMTQQCLTCSPTSSACWSIFYTDLRKTSRGQSFSSIRSHFLTDNNFPNLLFLILIFYFFVLY